MSILHAYSRVVVADFEYVADPGEPVDPVCFVGVDILSGERRKAWRDELGQGCPFPTDDRTLWVYFSGVGDVGCHRALGWPVPLRIVDLFPEVRQQLYDRKDFVVASLINACRLFGIPTMETADKEAARDLIIQRKFTDADRDYLLDYCEEDVDLTVELFRKMLPALADSLQRWNGVLVRGRYMGALSAVERNGIPMDVESWELASKHWPKIKEHLAHRVDTGGSYLGAKFSEKNFERLLVECGIPWPRLDSGRLALDDSTFRQQAATHGGMIANIRELRYVLSQLRLAGYRLGKDGRTRAYLNPFGSVTGRNQPSNTRFIFGSARWARSFIKPEQGSGVAYVDWGQQEIAIGAALSGDAALWEDYATSDVYMAFGKRAGIIPPDGTKATHKRERHACKQTVLGIGYGLTEHGLAPRIGCSKYEARRYIQTHQETYRTYHRWADRQMTAGSLGLPLRTCFMWERRLKPGAPLNPRSMKNWYMQATGAEMMRLALCELVDAGIRVCCPVHDAFLIEAPLVQLDQVSEYAMQIMGDTSERILGEGYRVRCDADLVNFPDVYKDENGGDLFETIMQIARECEAGHNKEVVA